MECVGLRYPKSPKEWLKRFYSFFGKKFNFSRIKSATKSCSVKTSSGKVVMQSISYEIAETYRMESVSFHPKYWLKLTYPLVARCHDLGHERTQCCRITSCLKYSAECGQLQSELFGHRQSTMQSHVLFALATPL